MDLKSGYPFSLVKNGLPFDYPKLAQNQETDVAIIGGGISGALVSYYLQEAGVDCITIDGRTIGTGSSCASTSLLQYEIDTPLHKLKEMVSEGNAIRSYELCAESIDKLGKLSKKIKFPHFQFRQSVYFAAQSSDIDFLHKEYDARKNAGFDVRFLNPDALQNEIGFKAPGAILSNLAAETDAYMMTHYIHQYTLKKGAKVFDRTKAEHVIDEGNSVIIYTQNGYKIKAKKIVYATGYEVSEILAKNIVNLNSTFACVSEQFNEKTEFWKNNALLWNTANPYLYMRTTTDNRIIIGGSDDKNAKAHKLDKLLAKKVEQLVKKFNEIFPDIPFVPEYSWAGTFGATKDGLPYIGQLKEYPNAYFSLGFGGNGITFSQIGAEIIRDLFLGKPNPDSAIFSFYR